MPGGDLRIPMVQTPRSTVMGPEKGTLVVQLLGESSEENTTRVLESGERDKVEF